uniref:Uncharacterized protein n=1 Tax=Mycena chlorophos TaxID=658473 RepID=A0ABQ0LAT8_MYCCL|nr:predicted protein [Mycena chlorophos]
MLLLRYPLRLIHQQRPEALVLELRRVASVPVNGNGRSVYVQLAHDAAPALDDELRPESALLRALAEPQQANFERGYSALGPRTRETFPIRHSRYPPKQLESRRSPAALDGESRGSRLRDTASPDTLIKVLHPVQGQLAEVARVLAAAGHERRERNVALDKMDTRPWPHGGHQREYACNYTSTRTFGV